MQRCRRKKLILLLCALLALLSAAPVSASSLAEKGTLTVQCLYGAEIPIVGMNFTLYRIADIDQNYKITPTEAIKPYPVKLDAKNADEWDGVAQALLAYVQKDALAPTHAAVIGDDGSFTLEVERGLYLVVGKSQQVDGYTYKVKPSIVSVPNMQDGEWNYDVTMIPKIDRSSEPGGPPERIERETVDRKALKVWDDEDNEDARPEEITVHLLRNGEVFATEILKAANGWSCEWRELAAKDVNGADYEWSLVEDPVDGYTVSLTRTGITFVLTNTYLDEVPDEPVPLGPGTPGSPDEPLEELLEDPVPLATLPQTGVLWWPVPIFLCLGILFLTAGAAIRRRDA